MTRFFALILVFGLAACGPDTDATGQNDSTSGAAGDDGSGGSTDGHSTVTYTGPLVAYKGRFVDSAAGGGAKDCAWSGCAVETRFTGSSVSIGLSSASNANIYLNVAVDGGAPTKLKLSPGVTQPYLVSSPAPKQAHTLRWTKISEASYGSVTFTPPTASDDGALLATQTPTTRFIEFVGDSITAGYGVLGDSASCKGTAENEDADSAYPALVGQAFGADYMQLAYSGRGVAYNSDCSSSNLLPQLYAYAVPPGTQNAASTVSWDANQFAPAVIVLNAGTNDFAAAFGSGSCNTQSATNNPGLPDQAAYESAYKEFLQMLSAAHPDAYILVLSGPMLSTKSAKTPEQAATNQTYLQDVLTALGNDKIQLLPVGPQGQATGCDYHPNQATHAQVAQAIETAIEALPLGWTL